MACFRRSKACREPGDGACAGCKKSGLPIPDRRRSAQQWPGLVTKLVTARLRIRAARDRQARQSWSEAFPRERGRGPWRRTPDCPALRLSRQPSSRRRRIGHRDTRPVLRRERIAGGPLSAYLVTERRIAIPIKIIDLIVWSAPIDLFWRRLRIRSFQRVVGLARHRLGDQMFFGKQLAH